MSTQIDLETKTSFNRETLQESLPQHYRTALASFQKISRSFIRFNLLFFFLAATEISLFLFFLPALSQSSVLATSLGLLFITLFSYPVLLFYYQAKKPEQLSDLVDRFMASCKTSLGLPTGTHHLSAAETLLTLSQYLTNYEWQLGPLSSFLSIAAKPIAHISAYCYSYDVFRFKQLLLHAAIKEHLEQVHVTPTDLELHASLANTYVCLSQLYKEPVEEGPRGRIYRKHAELFDEKFKTASKLAIEEFQILSQYAPNDPWIHEQLATGYQTLGMPAEQIREVELLLKLRPQDRQILFSLGALYFQQGFNAKGLQVYEELKKAHFKKVDDLIANYGKQATGEQQLMPVSI